MSLPAALIAEPRSHAALFNDPRYLALHAPAGARALVLEHHEDGKLVGTLAGVLDGRAFTSGFSAPFGGIDLVRGDETPARVVALVDDVVGQLDELGATTVRIRCRPSCHGAAEDSARFALLNAGFAVEVADLAFVLELRDIASADAWLAGRKAPFRRALRHAEPDRLTLRDTDDWERSFALLEANRAEKGRRLSIGLEQVLAVRDAFPSRVRLAELRRDGAPVAAALTYRATELVDLVVAWGDAGHGLERSPMPVLALRLVERALDEGLHALDLGTSTLPRPEGPGLVPNDGLVQFKRVCGARAELRPVLVRTR